MFLHESYTFTTNYMLDRVETGLVTKSTGSRYTVKKSDDGTKVVCTLRGKLRLKGAKSTNPVTVGDVVDFEWGDLKNQGIIVNIHPRKNYIIRRSTKLSKQYHIIAANLDQAIVMMSMSHPATPLEFVDRFLATCEAYEVSPVIVINKIDLIPAKDKSKLNETIGMYQEIGYQVLPLSMITKENFSTLAVLLKEKSTLIAGNSGVGKSTLINALNPELNIKTAEISSYHETGKHTTTYAEMFFIDEHTNVIDTPGIKGFGVIDMEKEEIYHFFPEIFKTAAECRFHNCLHVNEPGCAVKEALNEGNIHLSRYRSYINILTENENKYRIT